MATIRDIENLNLYRSDELCKLAEMLGYLDKGRFAINQLQCNNGAYASSLLSFFDDNPGAMEAVREWVVENFDLYDELEEKE